MGTVRSSFWLDPHPLPLPLPIQLSLNNKQLSQMLKSTAPVQEEEEDPLAYYEKHTSQIEARPLGCWLCSLPTAHESHLAPDPSCLAPGAIPSSHPRAGRSISSRNRGMSCPWTLPFSRSSRGMQLVQQPHPWHRSPIPTLPLTTASARGSLGAFKRVADNICIVWSGREKGKAQLDLGRRENSQQGRV